MPSIQTIGGPELQSRLAILRTFRSKEGTGAAFRAGAAVIRDSARGEAPAGRHLFGRPTGTIKQAIISFGSRRRGATAEPAAYARVNIISGRVRAPHAHLIEFGTKERRPKRGKFLVFQAELGRGLGQRGKSLSNLVFARRVAPVRANPFFARAVSKSSGEALDVTVRGLQQVIERLAEGKSTE